MKTTMLYSLLFLTMLGVGIGCKKEVEEVKPPVVVTPPVSTTPASPTMTPPSTTTATPIPVTDVASLTAVPPVLTVANCRLVRTVQKMGGLSILRDPEILITPNYSLTISAADGTNYTYDGQGRLKSKYFDRNDSLTYSYTPDSIRIAAYRRSSSDVPPLELIQLNTNGLAVRNRASQLSNEYDTEGYVIRQYSGNRTSYRYKIENGNEVEMRWFSASGDVVNQTTYYSDRPNLPAPTIIFGKPSRNLPKQLIKSIYGSELYDDGPVNQADYYYVYDARGLVKRRITVRTTRNTRWSFATYDETTSIIDYTYECP